MKIYEVISVNDHRIDGAALEQLIHDWFDMNIVMRGRFRHYEQN